MAENLRARRKVLVPLAVVLGLVAIFAATELVANILKVENNIVEVNGPVTPGTVDLFVKSTATGDAILGMGFGPSFSNLNQDALVFGYNGAFEQGSGFIGTRPTAGDGKINIYIKNTKEMEFRSDGINLLAGNDYRVAGVALNVPDYVFEDDYELMPLDDLATFVATNKHLPGIPSEEEVKAGSLGLSGFQMKLLEKIEELTLYTLDQEQRIAELQAQLEALQQ